MTPRRDATRSDEGGPGRAGKTVNDGNTHYSLPLPDFLRVSWTSDAARQAWEPRLARVRKAWSSIEWLSVAAGVRDCAIIRMEPEDFVASAGDWAERGLSALPFALEAAGGSAYQNVSRPAERGKPVAFRLALGKPDKVAAFKRAFADRRDDEVGRLLGYPTCCRAFFRAVWFEAGLRDTTWPMARRGAVARESGQVIEIGGHDGANVLWRWLGIRAVPHLPCAFDCTPSQELAQRLIGVGRESGWATEMAWLQEILSWPVEWSALHGIAEIKTPILKLATRTDGTARKQVVRRRGEAFPLEGARGLSFPYQPPHILRLTQSKAFLSGLEEIDGASATADRKATENGFASAAAMASAHDPIVKLATEALAARGGAVLDLGCGNGALLQKIHARCPDAALFGIDLAAEKIAQARRLLPQFRDNFHVGDLFADGPLWSEGRRYGLVILMAGRLIEIDGARPARLRARLARNCDAVLLYLYGNWRKHAGDLASLAHRTGFRLMSPVNDAGVVLAEADATSAGAL